MIRKDIAQLIADERKRQAQKWGCHHNWGYGDCSSHQVNRIVKSAVLQEECGEVARAVLEQNDQALKMELIQVAAVAVAWLETWREENAL